MMPSTFTSFDLMILHNSVASYAYIYGLTPTIILLQTYWMEMPTRFINTFTLLKITQILVHPTSSSRLMNFTSIILSTFFSIIYLNLWGAAPYSTTMTSHLFMTFSWGSPIWSALLIISFTSSIKIMSAHFLPENTPPFISSFLSLVETLSSYIRPITLSFRLAANISAGHVILGMMMSATSYTLLTSIILLSIPMMMGASYTMFELMICLIQAFVFTLLSSMYSNDYLTKSLRL